MALTKIKSPQINSDFSNVNIRNAAVSFASTASITPDLAAANIFTWNINGDKNLNLPLINPGYGIWYIVASNDSTGGHSLTLDSSSYNIVGNTEYDSSAGTTNLITLVSTGTRYDIWFQSFNTTYAIQNSLVLNGTSDFLERTFSAPTEGRKGTLHFWFKQTGEGTFDPLYGEFTDVNNLANVSLNASNGAFDFYEIDASVVTSRLYISTNTFRDNSAWRSVVIAWDTTQVTDTDRLKLYFDGIEYTDGFDSSVFPALDYVPRFSRTALTKWIGKMTNTAGSSFFSPSYFSDVVFVDGQTLTPSSFGSFDDKNNWIPGDPTKTISDFGKNGFWLDFRVSADLGNDVSGTGNDWATQGNEIQTNDTPSINLSILNSLLPSALATQSYIRGNSGLTGYGSFVSAWGNFEIDMDDTLEFYWEVNCAAGEENQMVGIGKTPVTTNYPGQQADAYGWDYASSSHNLFNNGVGSSFGAQYNSGEKIGIKAGNGSLTFYANGTQVGASTTGLTGKWFPCFRNSSTGSGMTIYFYDVTFLPSGAYTLASNNFPATDIDDPGLYFNPVIWTGDGVAAGSGGNPISGLGFQPDLVWIKARTKTGGNSGVPWLFDSTRGTTAALQGNATSAESTDTEGVLSFDVDGFTLGSSASMNNSGDNFVAWCWKKSAIAGFDIVEYSGDNTANRNINHALTISPEFVINKRTDGVEDWFVWHAGLSGATYFTKLNTTDSETNTNSPWGTGNFSSTQFMVTNNATNNTNATGTNNYITYLWASIPGFSKFGTYVNNNSTDGPFVYTGFRPAFVIQKTFSAGTADWYQYDSERSDYNPAKEHLLATLGDAEATTAHDIDLLSNGFKLRTATDPNFSTRTTLYAAWAEFPFVGSDFAPGKAR